VPASARQILMRDADAGGGEFEELESDFSAPLLDAFLERMSSAREQALGIREVSTGRKPRGRFLVHRFGRSLSTGEAEVSSRFFYDVLDRPPASLWVETLTRAVSTDSGIYEVALLAFVPMTCVALAEAGRAACPSGSLLFIDEIDCMLPGQLNRLIEADPST